MIMGVDRSGRYNFDRLLVSFREKPQPVTEAAEIMSGGGRVLLVTPHRELADVAMAMAALQVTVADPEIIKKTRIFAGPIIKELEIIGIPAIEALHYSTGILVGFPDTENTNRKIDAQEIDPRLVSETNDLMLKEFRDQVSRGDISLVATAPSGSTDFESDSEIVMKPVSRSTNTLGRRYFDAILPVALVIGSDGTEAEVGDLTRLKAGENLHDVMEQSLAPMYSRIAGKRVVYERPAAGPRISRRSRLGRVAI
jgi:hypothetical protein